MAPVEHYDVATGPTFQVGDKPGPGIYRCVQVPEYIVHIQNGTNPLPDCDRCQPNTKALYRRVVDERTAIGDE